MMVPVLVPMLLVSASTVQFSDAPAPEPRVRVWLDSEGEYDKGDRARVYVRTAEDGYLVILHADAEGRVRVLFPLDPVRDEFVRGGQSLEIRGRADRDAIFVDERSGSGLVLAAWSPDPFSFAPFMRDDHWDYRVIAPEGVGADPEAGLLDIVHQMAAGRPFEYDAQPYVVGQPAYSSGGGRSNVFISVGSHRPYCSFCVGWDFSWWSGFGFRLSVGNVYDPWHWHHRARFHDPFFDPWWWTPVIYRPVIYRPVIVPVYPRKWVWDPYWVRGPRHFRTGVGIHIRFDSGCYGDPFCRRGPAHRRLGFRPGYATGEVWDGGWTGRIGGGPGRSGWGTGYGNDNGIGFRRAQLVASVNTPRPTLSPERDARQAQPRGRIGQPGSQTAEPLRSRVQSPPARSTPTRSSATGPERSRLGDVQRETTTPQRATTQQQRSRTAREIQAEPPARQTGVEQLRSRAAREIQAEPPARRSSTEQLRSRAAREVQAEPPARRSGTEQLRSRANSIQREASPPRSNVREAPSRGSARSTPTRSSETSSRAARVRESVAPPVRSSGESRASSRSSGSVSRPPVTRGSSAGRAATSRSGSVGRASTSAGRSSGSVGRASTSAGRSSGSVGRASSGGASRGSARASGSARRRGG